MNAPAIAIDRITPTAFPIGGKSLCDDLFRCGFFEDLKLCRRRLANVLGGVFVVGIWRVFDVSHRCNNNASTEENQVVISAGVHRVAEKDL